MLRNNLIIIIRSLIRNKTFSLINILGLSIGLITFLAISLYVVDEFSYDRFHEKKDRIYRSIISANWDGQTMKWGGSPNKLAPTAVKEIPEIEKATRVFHHNFGDIGFISTETEKFSESNLFYADPEIFDVFTIPLIKGNPEKVLDRPGTVVISESTAKKYFGSDDPIGKNLLVDNSINLEITGIYSDFPSNSFLQCQLIASFSSNWFGAEKNQSWGNASFDTYFLLHTDVTKEAADKKIAEMLERDISKDDRWFSIALQPLLDIRLHSEDLSSNIDRRDYGDYKQVKILVALALIILLIAAVNYMNLTTAQSQRRNKEIGIAKTLGATFGQLNLKFYFEASVFVLLSLLIAITIFTLTLPVFNQLSGKNISIDFVNQSWFWISFGIVWMFLTFISGVYPALYLSSFSPKLALQKTSNSGGQSSIRKGLVVFQFSISTILIICSLIFYKQMNFIRDKKLGYQPEQVIAIMVSAAKDRDQIASVKTEFESLAEVKSVSRSQSYPGVGTSSRNVVREGATADGASILTTRASYEILDVLGIKLLTGKTLPENKNPKDTTIQVVINKSTSDYLGLSPEEVVGKRVEIQGFEGPTEVVGVTEDFHVASLHQKIGPYCFHNSPTEGLTYLLVKVQTQDLTSTVKKLETIFKKTIPSAFEYSFLDQQMAKLYHSEERLSNIVLLFAGLAIFIACLGLYALASFTAEQRVKEIGVRKVLGASVMQIVNMLAKEFVMLVLIAFAIGVPVGYYLMNNWLEGFEYRTNFDLIIFVVAGAAALIIAWTTVSFESFRAARKNPVESLKSE
ncbi:MAG TPA: ABC transporter permease [Chryseolinea sp.]|nr:ABC transporter permease [Chryseolinea sp.]HPH45878.1 ABC transporter permease [Chryseolinea sp.]HPM30691.1 ABC transporter permease [Chryseolinea sp.]